MRQIVEPEVLNLCSSEQVFEAPLQSLTSAFAPCSGGRIRSSSSEALLSPIFARIKRPGFPFTAERRVLKSPPVSGATNSMARWAPAGTTISVPSGAVVFQVSILVNQWSGGSLVVPRRKATISNRWFDCVAGRSVLTRSVSFGCNSGTCAIGKVSVPRVTYTSILGPGRSNRASSARTNGALPNSTKQVLLSAISSRVQL